MERAREYVLREICGFKQHEGTGRQVTEPKN
jgi:hypothetical protein